MCSSWVPGLLGPQPQAAGKFLSESIPIPAISDKKFFCSPHLRVEFLFLVLYPGCLPRVPPASCHTPSFTHNFVNHHLSHTTLSTTIFHIQSHIHLHFALQAWHNLTSTIVPRGRRGTHGTWWRAWNVFGCL